MIEKFYVGLPNCARERDSLERKCEKCCGQMRIMQSQLTLHEKEGGTLICHDCAVVAASSPLHHNEFVGIDAHGRQTRKDGGWFKPYVELMNKRAITLNEVPDMPEGMIPAMMLPSVWKAGYAERPCHQCGHLVYADPADIAAVESRYADDVVFVCQSCGFEIYATHQEGETRSEYYRIDPARGCN